MILERDSNRRQIQENYRRELFNEIQERQTIKNKSRLLEEEQPKETFSLIRNIEEEQERRRNRQREYYVELEEQRQQEIKRKKQREEEERRLQREEDLKIQRQNQMLRKRYEEEKKKQTNKKQHALEQVKQNEDNSKKKRPLEKRLPTDVSQDQSPPKNFEYPQDSLDALQGEQSKNSFPTLLYPSRIENQEFNLVTAKRPYNSGYFQDLLMERRKFEEQTSSLRDLNRMLGAERNYHRKTSQVGIENLRQLERMLEEQSASLMNEYSLRSNNSWKNSKRARTHNATNYFDF